MPETFTTWIFVSDPKLKAKHQKLRVKNLTDPSNMEAWEGGATEKRRKEALVEPSSLKG